MQYKYPGSQADKAMVIIIKIIDWWMYSKLEEVTFDQTFNEIKQNSHLFPSEMTKLYFKNNNNTATCLLSK